MSLCIQFKSLLIMNIFFVCPCFKVPVSVNECFLVFFPFSLVNHSLWIGLILKLVTNRKLRHVFKRLLKVEKSRCFNKARSYIFIAFLSFKLSFHVCSLLEIICILIQAVKINTMAVRKPSILIASGAIVCSLLMII